jgi:hypothetical protein
MLKDILKNIFFGSKTLRKDSLQTCYLACNYLNIVGLGLCIHDDFLTDSHIHTDLS